jgi:hypothetical protein
VTAAEPMTALYDGRAKIGAFSHKPRGDYAMFGVNGKTIGRATSRKLAITAICAAAKKAKPTKH